MDKLKHKAGDIVLDRDGRKWLVTGIYGTNPPYYYVVGKDGMSASIWEGFVNGVCGHVDINYIFEELSKEN